MWKRYMANFVVPIVSGSLVITVAFLSYYFTGNMFLIKYSRYGALNHG